MKEQLNREYWRMKEGTIIHISKMASSHLINTIHLMERTRYEKMAECGMRGDLDAAMMYSEWPIQYEYMVIEASRRNLIYRGIENPIKERTALVTTKKDVKSMVKK